MTSEDQSVEGYRLAFPIYLDEPMMTSFLAHLEGGVARGESITTSAKGAVERSKTLSAAAKARLWVIDADASGEGASKKSAEDSTEVSLERNHTSASLFNLLYEYLSDDGLLNQVSNSSDLGDIEPGYMVEIAGRYKGNAFEDTIDAAAAFIPYIESMQAPEGPVVPDPPERSRSSNPDKRNRDNRQNQLAAATDASQLASSKNEMAAGMRLARLLVEDALKSPVRDLVIQTAGELPVVLTVSGDIYKPRVKELLRDGDFRVVGKVTRVFQQGDVVRLARRSVLGALGAEVAEGIVGAVLLAGIAQAGVSVSVPGPSLQVLPMAIFV